MRAIEVSIADPDFFFIFFFVSAKREIKSMLRIQKRETANFKLPYLLSEWKYPRGVKSVP